MKKIILLTMLLVAMFSCKDVTKGDDNETTLRITEIITSVDVSSAQSGMFFHDAFEAQAVHLDGAPSAFSYKYSMRANMASSGTGIANLVSVDCTYYKSNVVVGTAHWNMEAFKTPTVPSGTSNWTNTLSATSSQIVDSAKMTINYSSDGVQDSASSTGTFKDVATVPVIESFVAAKSSVAVGEKTTLSWTVSNATEITIAQDGAVLFGNLAASGSVTIDPTLDGDKSVSYVLTAKNGSNSEQKNIYITVLYPNVEYRVSGVKRAGTITMEGPGGSTVQYSNVDLPFSYKMTSFSKGSWVYVSAQNDMRDGCIKVQIYSDGKLYKEAESCGAYVIATASGSY